MIGFIILRSKDNLNDDVSGGVLENSRSVKGLYFNSYID